MTKQDPREPDQDPREKVSSLERMLSLLDLFTQHTPVLSVDAICQATGYTSATAYRYVRELSEAGLLAQVETGKYCLGPRIIQLDSQIAESDPLLLAMRDIGPALPQLAPTQNWHLCRLFRDQVICILVQGNLQRESSYKRGHRLPLFRGATSTSILSWLPERQLMRLYLENEPATQALRVHQSWADFKSGLRRIRQQGYAFAHAEIDPGVFALASPVFNPDGKVIGCITLVREQEQCDPAQLAAEGAMVHEVAQRLSDRVRAILGERAAEAPAPNKTGRKGASGTPRRVS